MVRIKKVRLERINMCTAIRTSCAPLDFLPLSVKILKIVKKCRHFSWRQKSNCDVEHFRSNSSWKNDKNLVCSTYKRCLPCDSEHSDWIPLEKNGKNLVLHVKYVLQYTYLTFPNVLFFWSQPFFLTVFSNQLQ